MGGVVENKKICGRFCEKLGIGLEVGFRYYVNTSVVVCCHNNESEYRRKNYFSFGFDIFRHSVVGGVVYYTVVIYGGGTHSARRYNAYTCIYNFKNGIIL